MQEIANSLVVGGNSGQPVFDWIPLLTGLIGGVLGIAATYIAAHFSQRATGIQIVAQKELASQELIATFVCANRVKWIEALRGEVAGFMATGTAVVTDIEAKVQPAKIHQKIDRANHHSAMVSLLLNHDEEDSRSLVAETGSFTAMLNEHIAAGEGAFEQKEVVDRLERIGVLTRRIGPCQRV